MIDALRAALGAPAQPVIVTPPDHSLYAPRVNVGTGPGTTRQRLDITNSVLSAQNPQGSWALPYRISFRYARITSYFNGIFVVSTTRPPTQSDIASVASGVANDSTVIDEVLSPGDIKVLDFGDVAERSLYIGCQLIGGGQTLPAGGIKLELDSEKFDVRTDNTSVKLAPATVPVPPLNGIEVPTSLAAAFGASSPNFAIPANATGLIAVIYGNVPARSQGTLSIVGDVSGAEYVPSQQQTFFNRTTILMGIEPIDANLAVTFGGPYTCHLYWTGPASTTIVNTPAVTISGTASVTIVSGTVTITNATIGVFNASGTKITSARPATELNAQAIAASTTQTQSTGALPPDIQALVVILPSPLANYAHLKIAWTGAIGQQWIPFELFSFQQAVYVVPITPTARDNTGVVRNGLDITIQSGAGGGVTVQVEALYESAPLWLANYPNPQLAPNQAPVVAGSTNLANNAALWLVSPVNANTKINVFEIITVYVSGAAGNNFYIVGHGPALPVALPASSTWLFKSGNSGAFLYLYHGDPLPAGDGIWIWNNTGGMLEQWHEVNYSLS